MCWAISCHRSAIPMGMAWAHHVFSPVPWVSPTAVVLRTYGAHPGCFTVPLIGCWHRLLLQGSAKHLHQLSKFRKLLLAYSLVYGIALDEVLLQYVVCPLAEADAPNRVHSISYRYNHVEVVIWNGSAYLSTSLHTNLCIFCTSCLFFQLSTLIDIADMSVDNSSICLEEFAHLSLCQPHGLSFQLDIQLGFAILTLVDNDFVV